MRQGVLRDLGGKNRLWRLCTEKSIWYNKYQFTDHFPGDGREMHGGRTKMPAERLKEEKADGTETFH